MKSLQNRFAIILIVSMCAVVLVATIGTWIAVSINDASRDLIPVAQHISVVTSELEQTGRLPRRPPFGQTQLLDAPVNGLTDDTLTAAAQRAATAYDLSGDLLVTSRGENGPPFVSYQLDDGKWLVFDLPRPPPPPPALDIMIALGIWLVIMVAGVASVALVLARRVTQPFAILEKAVADVGADGTLAHIDESVGSTEARQTATALNRLSARLQAAMESRKRLLAAAGHDLRTPITRMRLRAEFLPKDDRDSWVQDIAELELIAESAIKLVREQDAAETKQSLALGQLVRDVASDLKQAQLSVSLEKIEDLNILGDPLSLKRALTNVISNAATHGGGAVVCLNANGQQAKITVLDDGPGIAEHLMTQVFEPFFRAAPGRTRTIKGSGLGLAIAKESVERMGGTITISNRSERGLKQVLSFDLA